MFPGRFFGNRFFPGRYFGHFGDAPAVGTSGFGGNLMIFYDDEEE